MPRKKAPPAAARCPLFSAPCGPSPDPHAFLNGTAVDAEALAACARAGLACAPYDYEASRSPRARISRRWRLFGRVSGGR